MKKGFYIFIILFVLTIMGCSKESMSREGMSGEKPPEVFVKIGNEKLETKLGTYCWNATCVDKAGPVELLKGKEPFKVKPGEKISFVMDYEPKPNQFHLLQLNGSKEEEVLTEENHFTAPTQKGVYYYSYGVWWMDEKQENLSHGDAFYAFVLKVQ